MPIRYAEEPAPRAVFEGDCAPEEADQLLDWLRATPRPVVDLGGCEALHTALAQLLVVARVQLAVPPANALLAACLDRSRWLPGPAAASELTATTQVDP